MGSKEVKIVDANIGIQEQFHLPVMPKEVVKYLDLPHNAVVVDATVGLGGHSEHILHEYPSILKLIGMDVDQAAISLAEGRLCRNGEKVEMVNRNFIHIKNTVNSMGISCVDGIVADLGISSFQLERSGKGFSFTRNEPLDMRMEAGLQFSAYDLVNGMKRDELEYILKNYGEEKFSYKISDSIVKIRAKKCIQTSVELASIISSSIPRKFHPKKIHPATKTFQALRISVNNELDNLETFITQAVEILKQGARLVIISFHSLEDRIVKKMFRKLESSCVCPPDLAVCACSKTQQITMVTKSVLRPEKEEVEENPRARSSKMRVAEGA
ncbi:MAG: 16S rRNA (cytosine(1402)-N(4))-methyltransferase RsmH [Candidatus Dadabacteria bacterium]|nr:16S rRNA (cytosine(1402)-N(4))-methyltransferase RsmH [Candidatus Dadabacteria bacterium]MCY4262954.1 16S rRNA (cytosine(1402)-N(4))-methyltransferase RsmH [Candidatus Dadabacteria bacterium]